jgi:hypothetical protein
MRVKKVALAAVVLVGGAATPSAPAAAPGLSPHIYVATITGAKPAQPNGTWRVAINGPFFSVNEDGRAAVICRVHIVGNRVTFQDGTGPLACRGAQKSGTYMWRLAGKRLSRTRVKDSCVGRRTVFSRPFTVVV